MSTTRTWSASVALPQTDRSVLALTACPCLIPFYNEPVYPRLTRSNGDALPLKLEQDGLICFEMLGFAIAHAYVFPSREYRIVSADTPSTGRARFRSLFDVSDLYAEGARTPTHV